MYNISRKKFTFKELIQMMYIIEDESIGQKIYQIYSGTSFDDKELINTVKIRTATIDKNGFTYLMIYDEYMKPYSDAFDYLNYRLLNNNGEVPSVNSRMKDMQALKFLFSFEKIIGKKLKDFTFDDIGMLKAFLRGDSIKGNYLTFELNTFRGHETVNGYLATYRTFLSYIGQTNDALTRTRSVNTVTHIADVSLPTTAERHITNEKVNREEEVPDYIRPDEFMSVIEYIRKYRTLRDEIIVSLMYLNGLRLGECLGLTSDDLQYIKDEDDGEWYPTIIIRNRVSDKKDQNAKGCMSITNKNQYRSRRYATENDGWQRIIVSTDLFGKIYSYLENEHQTIMEKKYDNYMKYNIADRVDDNDYETEFNFYLFINSQGRPLSKDSWNDGMRKIFNNCNLTIDKRVRKHNLNHRFRHGFAMFCVKYKNASRLQLKALLRHKSVSSVEKYFKETTSDKIKIKKEYTDALMEMFPNLKGEWNNDQN